MWSQRSFGAWAIVVLASVGGCGSSGASGGGSGAVGGSGAAGGSVSSGPIARGDFGQKVAEAFCANAAACCQAAGYPYNLAGCIAYWKSTLEQLDSPLASYDEDKAGECAAFLASVASSCKVPTSLGPCEQTFQGSVPDGGSCTSSADCVKPPGGQVTCSKGTCLQDARLSLGEVCDKTCHDDGSKIECEDTPFGSDAGTCWINDGLQCLNGACAAAGQIGDDCFTLGCVEGAYCAWTTSKCAPRLPLGADCPQPSVDPLHACVVGTYCLEPDDKCVAKKPDGADCEMLGSAVGFECASGACNDGKCGPARPVSDNSCGG